MFELLRLGSLWVVEECGPIKCLVGAVILVLALLELVASCSGIIHVGLQR